MPFNKARQAGEVFPEKTQHLCYRAPEVYLGYPCTGALDIWALACTVRPSHRERRESMTSFADDDLFTDMRSDFLVRNRRHTL